MAVKLPASKSPRETVLVEDKEEYDEAARSEGPQVPNAASAVHRYSNVVFEGAVRVRL